TAFNCSLLTAHCSLNYVSDQIVIMRVGDTDIDEIAELWNETFGRIVDEHAAVYVGRLSFEPALPEQVRLFRGAFKEHAHRRADASAITSARDARLFFHQRRAPTFSDARLNFVRQLISGRAFFVRIGEDADAIKLDVAHEGEQFVEIFFRLAGKTCDERGAYGNAGHTRTHALDQTF